MKSQGLLHKMQTQWNAGDSKVAYQLRLNDEAISLQPHIGQTITLTHTGKINCIACQRSIPKTFQQGYCFPCTLKLAETDMCILKPELCHFHKGTCRDNAFAQKHCFIKHSVYLALSSHAKVGITREHQKTTRWADQGASSAIEILHVPDRKTAGEIEVHISQNLSDKTNWRKMLQNEVATEDLLQLKKSILNTLPDMDGIEVAPDMLYELHYPVLEYPKKITSLNLDKTPKIEDKLMGIKGQYLIFQNGVINLRKHQGYDVEFEI